MPFDSPRPVAFTLRAGMLRVLQSPSAAERITAGLEFIRSFAAATELLIVGSSREGVDDLVLRLATTSAATFGLHRFSLTQFAARLAIGKLAAAGVAPSSTVGAEALAVRAAYEAAMRNELPYFAPVTKFPGFARATATTIGDPREGTRILHADAKGYLLCASCGRILSPGQPVQTTGGRRTARTRTQQYPYGHAEQCPQLAGR
jgi:hypothetical protein